MSTHYCDKCGKEMKRTAKCEFYCAGCDNTIFDFSLQYKTTIRKNSILRILILQTFAAVEI